MQFFNRLASSIRAYPLLFLSALALIGLLTYLAVPVEFERPVPAPKGETDRVYFGDKVVVAQEFVPHRGLSGIRIPIGSDTYPYGPLILHIRTSIDGPDIAAVPLFSLHEDEGTFRFDAWRHTDERLLWILEAPHAPTKAFWVYREQDASAFPEGRAFRNERPVKGNFGFTEVWSLPRFSTLTLTHTGQYAFAGWEYTSALAGIVALLLVVVCQRWPLPERVFVWLCLGAGFGLHIWLSLVTPLIIDEGAYIQDALQSSTSLLPFRDFLTKGPLYLFALWVWHFIVPNTVVAWRLFSALIWTAGAWWFWLLTDELGLRRRSRLIALAAFSILPASVALTTPLLLQTTSVALSMLGLLLSIRAARANRGMLAALAAGVFAAAFFVRITAAIPALIGLVFLFVVPRLNFNMKLAGTYILTGLLLFGLVFGAAWAVMGLPKASVMVNMEALLISQNRQERAQQVESSDDPLIRTLTIESRLFWRTGVLLIAGAFLVPLMFVNRRRLVLSAIILTALYIVSWGVLFNLYDTEFLLPKPFISTQWLIVVLFAGLPLMTALTVLLQSRGESASTYWGKGPVLWLVLAWLILTIVAYSRWGRFRQSYLTELLPQIILLAAVGFDYALAQWRHIRPVWLSRAVIGLTIIFSGMAGYQGYVFAAEYPHTGTVMPESLAELVRLIQANVPANQMIFTAQPVATAMADRPIMFGYSHPGWYREARFGTISEEMRDLLFRKPSDITAYLRDEANYVLTDSRTEEIYFDGYPERAQILQQTFEAVGSIVSDGAGDTYSLYKRK